MKVTMRRLCRPGSLACRRRTGIEGRVMKPTGTPKVLGSVARPDPHPMGETQIIVTWDRPMSSTCDIKGQINVIIDGGTPSHPADVSFHGNKMIMDPQSNIDPGKAVTWAYDDSGPCDLRDAGGSEADNQTYAVSNPDTSDWIDEHGDHWKDETSNNWTDQ